MSENLFPYLKDPVDLALINATPVLVAPIRGKLPLPELGQMRFVVSKQYVQLEARTQVLEIRLPIARFDSPLPYGELENGIRLVNGPIPERLLEEAALRSKQAFPDEWAGLVVWPESRSGYELYEPEFLSKSGAHITYSNSLPPGLELVLDLHSHGRFGAYFSPEDDRSDLGGIYLSGVFGHCDRKSMSSAWRACAHGRFASLMLMQDCNGGFYFEVPPRDIKSFSPDNAFAGMEG